VHFLLCLLNAVSHLQEFAAGHVKGALNLDSTAFSSPDLVDQLIQQLESKSQVR
jgi:hypothetical protein